MTIEDGVEPCISCARPTQAGTRLFSDRRTTRLGTGTVHHLCGDCNERAIDHFGRQPNERDMVQIAARGAGMGLAAGHGGGIGGGRLC
jgi:hypothetical protein